MKTEEYILETAFRLFLEKGFSDSSTNAIIREAQSTKGGFYHCFESREDLILQVIEKYVKPYYVSPIANMQQAWEQRTDDVCTKTLLWEVFFAPQLFCVYQKEIGMTVGFRDFYCLLYEGIKKYEVIQKLLTENTKQREHYLRYVLERGKQRNEIAEQVDIDSCVMMTLAMQDGILALKVLDYQIDDEQKYHAIEEQLWRDIATQEAYQKYLHGGVNRAVS